MVWILGRLERLANWRAGGILVALMVACQLGFVWRRDHLAVATLLDARRWYTPTDVVALFDGLGAAGRRVYALTELTLDMVFPVAYGLAAAVLLVAVFTNAGRIWSLVPVAAAVADGLENLTIATLAFAYDQDASPVMWLAAVLTAAKSVLILASIIAVAIGTVGWLFRRLKLCRHSDMGGRD